MTYLIFFVFIDRITKQFLFKGLNWKQFGYAKGPVDTTLWVGSDGSHTPAHQDTYGYNIIAQVHGKLVKFYSCKLYDF